MNTGTQLAVLFAEIPSWVATGNAQLRSHLRKNFPVSMAIASPDPEVGVSPIPVDYAEQPRDLDSADLVTPDEVHGPSIRSPLGGAGGTGSTRPRGCEELVQAKGTRVAP